MTDEKMPCTFIERFEASFKISFDNPRSQFEGMSFEEIYRDKDGVTEEPYADFEIPFLTNPKDKNYDWYDDQTYIMDLEKIYDMAPVWVQNLMCSVKGWMIKRRRYGKGFFEELEALDRVTGPGVAKVQGGSSYGVNEPTVSDIKTSGAAPATDWSRVSSTRKDIVDLAKTFIGGTYVYGGDSPEEGFDCSGLILYVYKEAAGIDLYHQSAVQASKGRAVSVTEMQPGDIIAYDGSPKDGIVNHVSIYAGDGKAIHAVGTGKGIRMTAFDYAAPLTIRNLLD